MIAFPVLAALVAGAFGLHLLVRFARRGRWHEGVWAISMLLYAAASVALALGVADGWTATEFRAYWLFGAVLTVPYLALGEAYLLIGKGHWDVTPWFVTGRRVLLSKRAVAHALLGVVLVATAWALAVVRDATVGPALAEEFPLGREVFGDGTAAHRLAQLFSFPAYFLLLFGAVYSASRMRRSDELKARANGTALIALGATVAAIGSGVGAGFGSFALFSTSLAAGAALMYWGFLVAVRR